MLMTKYVEWDDPWQYGEGPKDWVNCHYKMLWEDVVRWRRSVEPRYTSDEQAVEDFLVIYWASVTEYAD
jgi:hypothetical protein